MPAFNKRWPDARGGPTTKRNLGGRRMGGSPQKLMVGGIFSKVSKQQSLPPRCAAHGSNELGRRAAVGPIGSLSPEPLDDGPRAITAHGEENNAKAGNLRHAQHFAEADAGMNDHRGSGKRCAFQRRLGDEVDRRRPSGSIGSSKESGGVIRRRSGVARGRESSHVSQWPPKVALHVPTGCELLGYRERIQKELQAVVAHREPLVPLAHLLEEPRAADIEPQQHSPCEPEDQQAEDASPPRAGARRRLRSATPGKALLREIEESDFRLASPELQRLQPIHSTAGDSARVNKASRVGAGMWEDRLLVVERGAASCHASALPSLDDGASPQGASSFLALEDWPLRGGLAGAAPDRTSVGSCRQSWDFSSDFKNFMRSGN